MSFQTDRDISLPPRSCTFHSVLMAGVRGICSLWLWQSRWLTSEPPQKGRTCEQGLTFGDGDLTPQVTVLLQLRISHFLQPRPLQLREALDGDRPQAHAAARHAVPGEVTLQTEGKHEALHSSLICHRLPSLLDSDKGKHISHLCSTAGSLVPKPSSVLA